MTNAIQEKEGEYMDSLNQIMREAISKSKVISIHAAAGMCDTKIDCFDPGHISRPYRFCARCSAMEDAASIIKQRILSLLRDEVAVNREQ